MTVNMTAGELEGIIGYKHELTAPLFKAQLTIHGLHDRAYVLVDGNFVKVNFKFNKIYNVADFRVTMYSLFYVLYPFLCVLARCNVAKTCFYHYIIIKETFRLTKKQLYQVVKRDEETSFVVSGQSEITILVENMGYMAWLSQGLGDYSNEYKGNTRCHMWIIN